MGLSLAERRAQDASEACLLSEESMRAALTNVRTRKPWAGDHELLSWCDLVRKIAIRTTLAAVVRGYRWERKGFEWAVRKLRELAEDHGPRRVVEALAASPWCHRQSPEALEAWVDLVVAWATVPQVSCPGCGEPVDVDSDHTTACGWCRTVVAEKTSASSPPDKGGSQAPQDGPEHAS